MIEIPRTDRERAEQIARYETCGAPGYDGERCDKQLCVGCRELAETVAAFAATVRAEARQEERQRCVSITKAEAVKCAERMAAAVERGDVETANMLEAQSVAVSRVQAAIEAGEDGKP